MVSLSSFGRDVWNISYKKITMRPLFELWHITYPISFFLSCNERFIDCIKAMFIHLLLLSTYRLHKVVWYLDGLYDVLLDVRVQLCWKWPRCLCTQLFDKVMTCLTLQDKHNIYTLSAKIKFICTYFETGEKNSPEAKFSYCF